MKKCIPLVALALAFTLSTSAFAMEVPTDTVVQNLNGSQQVIKTFTIDPGTDPQTLIEEPFVLEGYRYTFAGIVKADNHVEDVKSHTETVTVETAKDDLDIILEQLAPTIEYDDGLYSGVLSLDHTSLHTEATGYSTRSYTVSETKTIGQLDRNDMSYVPATTVKDGITLNLDGVDWQITGTDLVGEVLSPSSWQAVATYSGKAYYKAADGYITTAEYVGEITRSGVESVTYTLTYLGAEYVPAPTDEADGLAGSDGHDGDMLTSASDVLSNVWPFAVGGAGLAAAAVLGALLLHSRRQVKALQDGQEEAEDDDEEMEDTR